MNISDNLAREESLNIQKSFIVQAPAGSGKTTLLTSRFMALIDAQIDLSKILAITFTKKAADEMKHRINEKLKNNNHPQANKSLPIMTFDAFCNQIVNYMGEDIQVHDNPDELYYSSVSSLLSDQDELLQEKLLIILKHLDGNLNSMLQLLSNLLQTRDQWISSVLQPTIASNKKACTEAARQHANYILANLSAETKYRISTILQYTQKYNVEINNNFLLEESNENYIIILKIFCNIVLKSNNEWREKVDSRQGFVAVSSIKDKHEKLQAQNIKLIYKELINKLKNTKNLKIYCIMLKLIPTAKDFLENKTVMQAIEFCLPRLIAHFKVIAAQHNKQDFLENSIQAVDIVKTQDTNFLEILENIFNINHILLDEAQDTSLIQYNLLKAITQDWQKNDGNTLFIVGDPSQSIYKFRQAQVSLFEYIRKFGINNIKLEPIYLTSNFRSQASIISWVNKVCFPLFPDYVDFSLGAIQYHPSVATKAADQDVNIIFVNSDLATTQIDTMINDIKTRLISNHNFKCAILLRTRAHGATIINKLHAENISFFAESISPIMKSQIILDLLALTFAINNIYDKNHWLAALRAPWLGFTLTEIAKLSQNEEIILSLLDNATADTSFGIKCSRAYNHLITAVKEITYKKNSEVMTNLWHKLNGPHTLNSVIDIQSCDKFFEVLKSMDEEVSINNLETRLTNLYIDQANTTNINEAVCQIMTIHKAKGLEFDHVYLPFICQPLNKQTKKLLLWHNIINNNQDNLCILSSSGSIQNEKLSTYLKEVEKQKDLFESIRLFYVAITRAKKTLTLLANAEKISNTSILASIEPHIKEVTHIKDTQTKQAQFLNYIPISKSIQDIQYLPVVKTEWAPQRCPINQGGSHQFFGVLIHKMLELMATFAIGNYNQLETHLLFYLQENNINIIQQKAYLYQIQKLYIKIINKPILQWILAPHQDAASELDIIVDSSWYRIDRTFVINNTRWIIDYKTGKLPAYNYRKFLYNKYHKNLETYAKFFKETKVELAIYHVEQNIFLNWQV